MEKQGITEIYQIYNRVHRVSKMLFEELKETQISFRMNKFNNSVQKHPLRKLINIANII